MSSSPRTPLEKAAAKLLAVYGMKAIWDMHLAAAAAHGMGERKLAARLGAFLTRELGHVPSR